MTALAGQPFGAIARGFADVSGPSPQLVRVVATDAHEVPVWGRPRGYQQWQNLAELFRRIKPDFDPMPATLWRAAGGCSLEEECSNPAVL